MAGSLAGGACVQGQPSFPPGVDYFHRKGAQSSSGSVGGRLSFKKWAALKCAGIV